MARPAGDPLEGRAGITHRVGGPLPSPVSRAAVIIASRRRKGAHLNRHQAGVLGQQLCGIDRRTATAQSYVRGDPAVIRGLAFMLPDTLTVWICLHQATRESGYRGGPPHAKIGTHPGTAPFGTFAAGREKNQAAFLLHSLTGGREGNGAALIQADNDHTVWRNTPAPIAPRRGVVHQYHRTLPLDMDILDLSAVPLIRQGSRIAPSANQQTHHHNPDDLLHLSRIHHQLWTRPDFGSPGEFVGAFPLPLPGARAGAGAPGRAASLQVPTDSAEDPVLAAFVLAVVLDVIGPTLPGS